MAGYSGTPLPRKLGIKDGSVVAVVAAPGVAPPDLAAAGVAANATPRQRADVVLAFVTRRKDLESGIPRWADRITKDGRLWIAWPKKAARKIVACDMTEDDVRAAALPMGLVDNKVCAVDEVWSGLQLVWRKEQRAGR